MFAMTRHERIYVKNESVYGTIPVFGNTDCARFARLNAMNDVQTILRPDKTGTRSQTAGSVGRKVCNWSVEMGMAGPGATYLAAGTVPHIDPFLTAIFGAAGTHPGGGPYVYTLAEAIPSISIASYRKRAAGFDGADRVAHGCVAQQAMWNLGQDAATWTVSGLGQWALESDRLADLIDGDPGKGGYTTGGGFAAEPGAPDATDGGLCIGFTGSWTTPDGVMGNIRTAQVRIATGADLIRDTFGTFYPTDVIGGERAASISFSVYDKDDTNTSKLRKYANDKTPINLTMAVGSVPGNIWTFKLKNVQLASPNLSEPNARFSLDFGESRAFTSSLSVTDEFQLELS